MECELTSPSRTALPELGVLPCEDGKPSVVLWLHGGSFYLNAPATHRAFCVRLGAAGNAQVVCPNYRQPPEHPFPAAVEDAAAVYTALVGQHGAGIF